LVLDWIVHGHGFHPAFDLLTVDFRDVPFRVDRDDDAVELVFFNGRVRDWLSLLVRARAKRQHEQ
jgi:hypothetical protein